MLTVLSVWLPLAVSMKPKSKAVKAPSVTGTALRWALPEANAGTPTVATAAHANHGTYFLLNRIPGLSPSDGPRLRPKTTNPNVTSQRLLHMRGAKPAGCSSDD